eukprot:5475568-Prymnesium_polylepis.1
MSIGAPRRARLQQGLRAARQQRPQRGRPVPMAKPTSAARHAATAAREYVAWSARRRVGMWHGQHGGAWA